MPLTDSELDELVKKLEQSKKSLIDLKPSEKKLVEDLSEILKNWPNARLSSITDIKAYLATEEGKPLADLLKKRLDDDKANKARADALMQVSGNFNLAFDILEPLSKLPLVGTLIAPVRFACAFFEGKYVERAAKYNPDFKELVGAYQIKYVAAGLGAKEATLQAIAGGTFIVAFSPVILTGVAASLLVSRLMTTGLAFKKAWNEWGNSDGPQRLKLIGGCLSNVGKAVLGAIGVVLGSIASSISLGISTIIGTASILLSTLVSSGLACRDIVIKWGKLPGETSAFARRAGMISKFATQLALATLMAAVTVAAVAAVFNPIGLAVVGGTLLTVGIVTAAVAFAGFMGSWWSKRKEAEQKKATELARKKVETKDKVEDTLDERSRAKVGIDDKATNEAETKMLKKASSVAQEWIFVQTEEKSNVPSGKTMLPEKDLENHKHQKHFHETKAKEQKAEIEKTSEKQDEQQSKKAHPE